eukprot:GDKI01032564.1.p1 GENE.GDKI01032564.1~~GDKI01032564.1.p1  ORF type:complete len:222 (-),score=46.75 GDKI01032564.1:133-756(-)
MAAAEVSRASRWAHKLKVALTEWTPEKKRNWRLVLGTTFMCGTFWSCTKRVPPGHVGLIEDWNGNLKPYIYDDKMLHLYLPIYQRPVSIRVIPVKKKLIREFQTADDKPIEVLLQAKLQPRIPYVPEIYLRFGRDFGRAFLEQEGIIDLTNVIKQHTYETLIANDSETDKVVREIVTRLEEACAFHKLHIKDVSIIFRDPLAGEDDY